MGVVLMALVVFYFAAIGALCVNNFLDAAPSEQLQALSRHLLNAQP